MDNKEILLEENFENGANLKNWLINRMECMELMSYLNNPWWG